ncbi:hypothetical protein DTL21_11110 [Bremerella cremea]|uniref:VWFA domain-containing protein n=1 Tax=Blastopirellula marina TaxID=124 RepID=A0A2S8FPH0_9BACT|nr:MULTISPECIES: hypothetical protein [Pirellulaceae]PQO34086.1 hypothetical protein C5Y83_11105 [Blastopirellula marina]RCS46583.1 hypothetical protein DTL21_11110 [Bremerella cremea]
MNQSATNTITAYQFSRLSELPYWSQWALLAAVVASITMFVWWWSRRDSHALPTLSRYVLFGLRTAAMLGLLFFFFNLEKKTQREVRENSRVAVLVDTSQSMGLPDQRPGNGSDPTSRADQAIMLLSQSEIIPQLREQHDVSVMTFDDSSPPQSVAFFPRTGEPETLIEQEASATYQQQWDELTWITWTGIGIASAGLLMLLLAGFNATGGLGATFNFLSATLLLTAVILVAVGDLRNDEVRPWEIVLGKSEESEAGDENPAELVPAPGETPTGEPALQIEQIDWAKSLQPTGMETRIGDAVVQVVNQERGGPFSGILLVSDGANNEGTAPADAARMAQEIGARIVTVGLGSDEQPHSVRVVDLEAPAKAYPGDEFQLRGYIQGFGMPNKLVTLQVASGTIDENGEFREEAIEKSSNPISLGKDGEVIPVDFQITPETVGTRAYQLRIIGSSETDLDQSDNQRVVKVQIIEQRNRVLLLAGGPTREFRFLRNQLFRDKDVELHVLLQTGEPGISQESDELLFEFPDDPTVLFEEYDCIVAFDPDWSRLSQDQIELLERWVGEKAGGLIVIAGPIFTPKWASLRRGDPAIDIIKDLHPVTFFSRGTSIGLGRFGSETARKLVLTPEGQKAEALRLDPAADVSNHIWQQFPGVYGYFAVSGVKPGAANWADVEAETKSLDGKLPVYMASHFYGAGRVIFLGSGEMWRIRSMDVGYFETFYTKLIRYASQGRLARDSSRGLLLVSAERVSLGETVEVRAFLTDAQHNPLTDPQLEGRLILPDGTEETLLLRQLPEFEEGQYAGQFTPLQDGEYRIEVNLPGGGEDSLLAREVRARIPDREIARPQRDDAVLTAFSSETGGQSIVGITDLMDSKNLSTLVGADVLPPRDMYTALPDLTDRTFQEQLRGWLLAFIVIALSVEWIQRRFAKLA